MQFLKQDYRIKYQSKQPMQVAMLFFNILQTTPDLTGPVECSVFKMTKKNYNIVEMPDQNLRITWSICPAIFRL